MGISNENSNSIVYDHNKFNFRKENHYNNFKTKFIINCIHIFILNISCTTQF